MKRKITTATYLTLSLPATAMGFALCVQIAALSWILSTRYGLNLEEIGYVWLAGPVAGILGQVIIGVVSDKVWFWGGRRRPFILIGGVVAALMILALPHLDVIGSALGLDGVIGVAITVALLLDLAINVSFNPARSIIADVTPAGEARTRGYTWMQTISGFFGVLAYLIGAFVSNYFLIYLGAVIVFLFAVVPPLFIAEPRALADAGEVAGDPEVQSGLVAEVGGDAGAGPGRSGTDWPAFLRICLAHAFTWVGVQTMFIYTFGFIREEILGLDPAAPLTAEQSGDIGFSIGVAFAILNTVGFLLPALVLEPLAERIGRVRTHTAAIAVAAVGYLAIVYLGTSLAAFFLLMAVVGVGWAAVVSLPFAIMSEVVDQRRMGLFMGLFNLSVVLPQIVASNLGGLIEASPEKDIIFWIAAGALGASAVLWLWVREPAAGATSPGGAG